MEDRADHAFIVAEKLVDDFFIEENRDTIPLLKYLLYFCLFLLAFGENACPAYPHGADLTHSLQLHIEQGVINDALAWSCLPLSIVRLNHLQRQSKRHNYHSVILRHLNLLKHAQRVVEAAAANGARTLRQLIRFIEISVII